MSTIALQCLDRIKSNLESVVSSYTTPGPLFDVVYRQGQWIDTAFTNAIARVQFETDNAEQECVGPDNLAQFYDEARVQIVVGFRTPLGTSDPDDSVTVQHTTIAEILGALHQDRQLGGKCRDFRYAGGAYALREVATSEDPEAAGHYEYVLGFVLEHQFSGTDPSMQVTS